MKRQCACCGGSKLFAARAVDVSDGKWLTMRLHTYRRPDAAIFKGVNEALLRATVCEECGYVMYFANHHDIDTLRQGRV